MEMVNNNDVPLISVITLTYNHFEHVFYSIKSVLLQDYPKIEYIICDDGSENFPKEAIAEYVAQHSGLNLVSFKLLQNEKNVGTVRNGNRAYKEASGQYYVNLACGDVFFETNTVSKIAARFKTSGCDMMTTSRLFYDTQWHAVALCPPHAASQRLQKLSSSLEQYTAFVTRRDYGMASGSSMCYSRAIMEKMNYFDEQYVLLEDAPFVANYLWENRMEFAFDIISIWYERTGVSMSPSHPSASLFHTDWMRFVEIEMPKHIDALPCAEQEMIRFRQSRYFEGNHNHILTDMRFFPQFLQSFKIWCFKKYALWSDRKILKSLLNSPTIINIQTLFSNEP